MAKYTITVSDICEAYVGIKPPNIWEPPRVIMEDTNE